MSKMQKVYVVCGVPGSGKTWVSRQLAEKFHYVPHDEVFKNHAHVVAKAAREGTRPVITECPFAEREFRALLTAHGIEVKPYFVVEAPDIVKARYEGRENRTIPQSHLTRATTIKKRVDEWHAPHGTSDEVLALLQKEP